MRFILVQATALLSAGFTFASNLEIVSRQLDLPTCALPCLTATSSTSFGNCSSTDEACLCTNPQFISNTTTCIEGACTGNDLQTAISAAESLCAQAGVTIDASSILASVSATATAPLASASSGSTTANPSATSASGNDALSNKLSSGLLCLGVGMAWINF
ncbi:hypothetical protein J3R30DRAFT_3508291 [Lentinula aciculospora]|uniref:CFEM domain-containing protein n=1 Tax=Lentinula aciculospora TaxID=153920 RepID=A0A9W9DK12_9AGAR|nr:hypothetical protein J3R30DRAFT_3508291 [Lentinula aciculospora]